MSKVERDKIRTWKSGICIACGRKSKDLNGWGVCLRCRKRKGW